MSIYSKHYPSSARNHTARGDEAGQECWDFLNAIFNGIPHDSRLRVLCKPPTQRHPGPSLPAWKFLQCSLINDQYLHLSHSACWAINCLFWGTFWQYLIKAVQTFSQRNFTSRNIAWGHNHRSTLRFMYKDEQCGTVYNGEKWQKKSKCPKVGNG